MSRNDADAANSAKLDNAPSTVKPISKFKFNPPKSRQNQTVSDENRTVNTIEVKPNLNVAKKNDEHHTVNAIGVKPNLNVAKTCDELVVISDEDQSPVKSVTAKKMDDDDIFADFDSPQLSFVTASKLAKNDVITMDDLYAKYGSPEKKSTKSLDTLDIDAALNANPSYTNAVQKLEKNMEPFRASPKKTGASKFKFVNPSKPKTTTNQNATAQKSNSSSTTLNISSLNTSVPIGKTFTSMASTSISVDRFSSSNGSSIDSNPYRPQTVTSVSMSKPPTINSVSLASESFISVGDSP